MNSGRRVHEVDSKPAQFLDLAEFRTATTPGMNPLPCFGQHAGSLVDEQFLSPIYAQLRQELPAEVRNGPDKGERFLAATSVAAQMVAEDQGASSMTAGELRDSLIKLAAAAAKMQTALLGLSGEESAPFLALEMHLDFLRATSIPPVELPEDTPAAGALCGRLWQDLEVLALAAKYSADKTVVRQEAKAGAERARVFVRLVAEAYRALYGELPPYSKLSWFAYYMQIAGNRIRVPCGPAPVEAAIKALRAA